MPWAFPLPGLKSESALFKYLRQLSGMLPVRAITTSLPDNAHAYSFQNSQSHVKGRGSAQNGRLHELPLYKVNSR